MKPNYKYSSKYFRVQNVLAFLSSLLGCTSLELLLVVFLFSHVSTLKMRGYFFKNKLKKNLMCTLLRQKQTTSHTRTDLNLPTAVLTDEPRRVSRDPKTNETSLT
jgi:hypothetical protein